jgi:serine/threonine-protein kinase
VSEGVATGGVRRGPNGTCELDVGSVIGGRYQLVRFVGRGAMGVVFEAEHLTVGRRLAVKVLSHEWAHDPNMGRRFRAEARAASAAGHPNIVEVFDAGELDDGRPYLVMEFLEGREALQVLREEGPLEVLRACRIIRDVARALHVAHEVGIVHRDLKAENVFVIPAVEGKNETVKVLDFGIATRGDVAASRMTTPGVAVGTPEYMAPEQAFGARPQPAFDIYAIGVLLFELLTGTPPFVSDKPVQVLGIKASTPAPRVSEQRSDLPGALVTLVAECLEIDPDERPRTAGQIADRLDAIIEELVRPLPLAAVAAPRRVQGWAVAGATGVALAAVFAMFLVGLSPEPMPIAATGGVIGDAGLAKLRVAGLPRADLRPAPVEPEPEPAIEPEPEPVEPEPLPVEPEPRPKVDRTPKRPAPAATPDVARPEREPKPAPPVEAGGAEADTPECELDRRRATEARQVHDWSGTLRHTANKGCWSSSIERKRLRVQALMELERWSSCNAEAAGSNDPKILRWATICSKRLEE